MMPTKRYNLLNNAIGWGVFVIALLTYWFTLEPTASYWDCGEFIIQADKLEIGHPPGNPIFMLTARFFANFAIDQAHVALMVNVMSGLLSALTILLLFWTITHLVRKLIVKDGNGVEPNLRQYLAIMGSGVAGALAYTWSDTFWFSAVEGEVYAFSSFCTALVFWLILKWENRADEPHSDRYLILIAYIIGVSVAVHLLNLLCIPAIVLVFAYKKFDNMNVKKSIYALLVSFAIVVLVLYGLVPGFIKVAQWFELLCVNGLGMSFNSGVLIYTILAVAAMLWSLWELYKAKSSMRVMLSFVLAIGFSGMLFFGRGIWVGLILLVGLFAAMKYVFKKGLPIRILNVTMWSIFVIFVGYSSYALILIRSNADTPMNQNSPDNVFALSSYLNREQYGERPLFYGQTPYSETLKEVRYEKTLIPDEQNNYQEYMIPRYYTKRDKTYAKYSKGVDGAFPEFMSGFGTKEDSLNNAALAERGGDYYALYDYNYDLPMQSEMNMLFPRLYSSDPKHIQLYEYWGGMRREDMNYETVSAIDAVSGEKIPEQEYYTDAEGYTAARPKALPKPTFGQNLRYFFDYQLNHMYLRYFMWNFAGRQNDITNQQGELDAGNWLSGIPFIDNARLGDQSLLPDYLGKDNKGHNVFYMLPLILGIIGLLWQAFAGLRGIRQFWVVFFLFFMTGIAIVLYLNQTPLQPRERDYAFAGSFYAWAIWIGMGVAGLWRLILSAPTLSKSFKNWRQKHQYEEEEQLESLINEPAGEAKKSKIAVIIACIIGLVVPLQMVSQTWDDHDRSGRTAARDYAINYLESLEPNAIIFCNGDNDTFPLWYAQEVEGVRRDVRIINLSYLNSDWYANQMRMQAYESAPVSFTAEPKDYAYDRLIYAQCYPDSVSKTYTDMISALKFMYSDEAVKVFGGSPYIEWRHPMMYIPVNKADILKNDTYVAAADSAAIVDRIELDLSSRQYLNMSEILMLDIIATNAANGWQRPIYWASTVPNSYHLGLTPYMKSVGMTYQLVPTRQAAELPARTDKAYEVIKNKYRWGVESGVPYFDETAGRMLTGVRTSIIRTTGELITEGDLLLYNADTTANTTSNAEKAAEEKYLKAKELLLLLEAKLPQSLKPYSLYGEGMEIGEQFVLLGRSLKDKALEQHGFEVMEDVLCRYAQNVRYTSSLRSQFMYPSLSYENAYLPDYYYSFVDTYESLGGDIKKLQQMPAMYGIDLQAMKKLWQEGGSSAENEDPLLQQLGQLAVYIRELQGLSPEEYVAQPLEVRQLDTIFLESVIQYLQAGGSEDAMLQMPEFAGLDLDRSMRLYDEYLQKNSEQ